MQTKKRVQQRTSDRVLKRGWIWRQHAQGLQMLCRKNQVLAPMVWCRNRPDVELITVTREDGKRRVWPRPEARGAARKDKWWRRNLCSGR